MKMTQLRPVEQLIANGYYATAWVEIDRLLESEEGDAWHRELRKLQWFLIDPKRKPVFKVLAKDGNSKLPFLAFSNLPGINCPGAGDCLNWCYSYRSHRYPAAWARQVQNTVLMQTTEGRKRIVEAFVPFQKKAEKHGKTVDFRLYVDGDFKDAEQVIFWFDFLKQNPWIKAYGYSKSFDQIIDASDRIELPDNYLLNISGGHNSDATTIAKVKELSITRGEFVAVNVGHAVKSSDHGNRQHQKELRDTYTRLTGRKAFTCPGQCGDCIINTETRSNQHACGADKMRGVDVIIAVH